MNRYLVQCQSAAGVTRTVEVKAENDESACSKALKNLNDWRAIRAVLVPDTDTA